MTPLQRKFHRLIRATGIFDDQYYSLYNPDVAAPDGDLLTHYLQRGEQEGRRPNPFFDPEWYRLQSPRMPLGGNLLAHCLTVGDEQGLQPMVGLDPAHVRAQFPKRREPALLLFARARGSGRTVNPNRLFDYGWYLGQYPEVALGELDPYQHFVLFGADEGRLPSQGFDWAQLRARHELTGGNAEAWRQLMLRWHELGRGRVEAAKPVAQLQATIAASHARAATHETPGAPIARRQGCDVYAVYSPEFHAAPENEMWWGEGHSAWHRVIERTPAFPGHFQPHVPAALGFYDQDDPAVLPRQIALAGGAGIAGFAWRYYNFGGRALFQRPLERFLADPALDMGFFLTWMNGEWSRAGRGGARETLMRQRYTPDFPEELAEELARHVRDVRYRRLAGRPLFVIDRPADLPEAPGWIARLRAACVERGFAPQLFQTMRADSPHPSSLGLDGGLALEPQLSAATAPAAEPKAGFARPMPARVIGYDALAAAAAAAPAPDHPVVRGCAPGWDDGEIVLTGATPAAFERWLRALVTAAGDRGLVCVNGWNLWREGAHLEPDRHHGHAWLNAVRRVMAAP